MKADKKFYEVDVYVVCNQHCILCKIDAPHDDQYLFSVIVRDPHSFMDRCVEAFSQISSFTIDRDLIYDHNGMFVGIVE